MFGEEKNLKDSEENSLKDASNLPAIYQPVGFSLVSYTKTDKLVTALYMVTDMIDKDEPLRNKLRTLGTGIISDMHLIEQNNALYTMSFIRNKISEIMSFLDIASAVNIISEMNCSILRKEFFKLDQSVRESSEQVEVLNRGINIAEFLSEEPSEVESENGQAVGSQKKYFEHTSPFPVGSPHRGPSANIGVQNGSTLMKALGGVMSDRRMSDRKVPHTSADVFDALKKQREESIINIIKNINGGATIKDIKDRAKALPGKTNPLASCGEKTLQRELVSMVKNGVLNKTGEKRWSRYFLKN
jgi:hypothetical protein